MRIQRRQFISTMAAATAFSWDAVYASSAPDIVKIVVGFPAGTTPDVLARKISERLNKGYAKAAMVDSRAGAGGQLAVTQVKNAPADGSVILLTPMSMLGVYPYTYKRLPYDPIHDLAPVSMGVTYDYGIAVGPKVPESVKTISDLMAWYKANPAQANMGSPATGSTLHFTAVMLGRAAGVNLTHVGYKGSGAAVQDLLGGTLPALCAPLGTFLNQPSLRVLATTGAKRSRFTPNVPTLVEAGYKDMVFDEWYGFFLPGKSSPETVLKLNAALREALASKDIVDTLANFGMEATPSSPEQLGAALKADMKKWEPVVKSVGFSVDS